MKAFISTVLVGIILTSCSIFHKVESSSQTEAINTDLLRYKITVLDPYFDKWYQMNHSAALERDGSFYKNRNYLAVNTWNNYYREGRYPNHVMSYIQYNPAEDYGVEVNRLLYWYFKYMQETYRIRLLH